MMSNPTVWFAGRVLTDESERFGRKCGLIELIARNLLMGTKENHIKPAGIAVVSGEI
jgi:hypothetical protein